MGKIIEFDKVYLEYPDELVNAEEKEAEKLLGEESRAT